MFLHTIKQEAFDHFSKYDYDSWKPPKARRDWVRSWVGEGEYLDIGCGAYPVTMDVKDGKERGIGVDIAPQAAHTYTEYFKEFYLFNIEKIKKEEVPGLVGRFSTVVISETLEHFHDPMTILEKLSWFLEPPFWKSFHGFWSPEAGFL